MKTTPRATLALLTAAGLCLAAGSALQAQSSASFSFDRYHTVGEFESFIESVAVAHPEFTTLLEIGRSRAGHRILALEINNPVTGPAEEKPGFYVDGNIHGGEVLGGEAALYFIDGLFRNYGTDQAVTDLVDRVAFYIVPLVNPDGRAISIDTPENHRWNIRPVDEDGDGLQDEDPPEDLDGDGRMLQMRVADPNGRWKISPDDPRRMMRRRAADQGGSYYQVYSEGVDNDGDGRFNEDRVGGVDLNRNFPANWSAAQFASGPFPLSEPESFALVQYITDRPNIAAVHTFHTSGGLLLRFPALADQEWEFPAEDIADYDAIAEAGIALTGYDNYANSKKSIVDLMAPGHGVFNDWASKEFGVLAMTTELWKHPMGRGPDLFTWNDEVLSGTGFVDWTPFTHPALGEIEIGGWDRWSISNPPEALIEAELERNFRWVLTFAERVPRVTILQAEASASATGEGAFDVRGTIANLGWMGTSTVQASEVLGIAQPVRAHLELENARLSGDGVGIVSIGILPGNRGGSPEHHEVAWRVQIVDSTRPAHVQLVVVSEKGGTVRQRIELVESGR
jgi:murein tripeptide amidase MpaA